MDLDTHERKIIAEMRRIRDREEARASDAGEDRESIGHLLELTGLNKKAFGFVRSLDRMADDKRADVLRSLDPLLKLMQPHWDGGTPDMLETPVASAPEPQTREAIEADVAAMGGAAEPSELEVEAAYKSASRLVAKGEAIASADYLRSRLGKKVAGAIADRVMERLQAAGLVPGGEAASAPSPAADPEDGSLTEHADGFDQAFAELHGTAAAGDGFEATEDELARQRSRQAIRDRQAAA